MAAEVLWRVEEKQERILSILEGLQREMTELRRRDTHSACAPETEEEEWVATSEEEENEWQMLSDLFTQWCCCTILLLSSG
jgi:hypothetical protein